MNQQRPSIASIVDPLLLNGSPRLEIVKAIKAGRPDFKCPTAAIGNRIRALLQAGKDPKTRWARRVAGETKEEGGAAKRYIPRLRVLRFIWEIPGSTSEPAKRIWP